MSRPIRSLCIALVLGTSPALAFDVPASLLFETRATAVEFQPRIPFSGRINAIARHPANPHIVLVSTPTGGLFRSINGGSTWVSVATMPAPYARDVIFHPDRPNIAIATAQRDFRRFQYLPRQLDPLLDTVFRLAPEAPLPGNDPPPAVIADPLPEVAAASNLLNRFRINASGGGIWISRDYGATWFRPPSAVPRVNTSFSSPNACPPKYSAHGISTEPGTGTVFVGTDCGVAISRNYGQSWKHVEVPSLTNGEPLVSVEALGAGIVLAGASQGVFWSRDGGMTWTEDTTPGFRVSDLHAIGDTPVPGRALVVDASTNLYAANVSNSGLQLSPVGMVPTSSGACGGIGQAEAFFGEPGAAGRRQRHLYVFYGNRCSPYAAKATVTPSGILFPTTTAGWIKLDQNHADFRHILPKLRQGDKSASGGTDLPTISGFEEPLVDDNGALEDDQPPDFPSRVAMIANDGGLDIYNSSNTPVSVGSGPGRINALQLYEVTGQRVDVTRHDIYIGTQDNRIRASIDGGATWPGAVSGEGMGINAAREVASAADGQITYMGCGACKTGVSDTGLANPKAWPDPFDDDKFDTGYPLILEGDVRVSYGRDDQGNDERSDDTIHFFRTNNAGASWTKLTDAITGPVRDSVQISVGGLNRPNIVFSVLAPKVNLPYYDGDVSSKVFSLGVVPNALRGSAITTRFPAMNGFGGLGRVPFQFKWAVMFGMDSWDANHLIAADVVNQTMAQTFDLGDNWSPMVNLTRTVTRDGAYFFSDAYHNRDEHYPLVSAITFHPDDPKLVLLGTRHGGMFVSGDRGRNWNFVTGSEAMTNVTSIYWASKSRALASSYGRGLWSIHVDRTLVFPAYEMERWIRPIFSTCIRENPCRFISSSGDELRNLAEMGQDAFDEGFWVFDGGVSKLELADRRIKAVAVTPGATAIRFGSEKALAEAQRYDSPAMTEFAGPLELAGGYPELGKAVAGQAVIGVVQKNGTLQGVIVADEPIPWTGERRDVPSLAMELGSRAPMAGVPHISVEVSAVEVKGREAKFVLFVKGNNLEPGRGYEVVLDDSDYPKRQTAKSDRDGSLALTVDLEQTGPGEGTVRLMSGDKIIDSELYLLPHIDLDEGEGEGEAEAAVE